MIDIKKQRAECARMQGLCDAATKGPWDVAAYYDGLTTVCQLRSPFTTRCVSRRDQEPGSADWPGGNPDANAEFIASSRTDWPALIKAHIEALDAIEDLTAALASRNASMDGLSAEIERLREAMRVGCRIMGWPEDGSWPVHARDSRDERWRRREAGARLAAQIRIGDEHLAIRRDAYSMRLEEDCRTFEEGA
jgi:hypothetical protein